MKRKVFCKYCKYFRSSEYGEWCSLPELSYDTYYEPKSRPLKEPSIRNEYNDCKYYEKKWWHRDV